MAKSTKRKVEVKRRRSPSSRKKSKSRNNNNKSTNKGIMSLLFKLLISANIILFLYFAYIFFYEKSEDSTFKKSSIEEKMNRKKTSTTKTVPKPKKASEKKKIPIEIIKDPSSISEYISKEANKYLGMKYKLGGNPDKGLGTDNSHMIHSIISNSEKKLNNGKSNFKYRIMSDLIKDSYEISISELSNGDLIILKDGMIGMIIDEESRDGYSVIYVSGKQKKVVKVESSKLGIY